MKRYGQEKPPKNSLKRVFLSSTCACIAETRTTGSARPATMHYRRGPKGSARPAASSNKGLRPAATRGCGQQRQDAASGFGQQRSCHPWSPFSNPLKSVFSDFSRPLPRCPKHRSRWPPASLSLGPTRRSPLNWSNPRASEYFEF